MPAKSAAMKHLDALVKKHLSKKIVGRELQRGVKAVGRAGKDYIKSGAFKRDLTEHGGSRGTAIAEMIGGMGDYSVGRRAHKPKRAYHEDYKHRKVERLENGELCISHREYLGELVTQNSAISTFLSQNYGINAGNAGTFPWLATIANSFQNYRFEKCIFEYVPLTSESTSSSTGAVVGMGSVILATQYDSVIGSYLNKAQMENSDFAVSAKPSEHLIHAIECNPRFNPLGEYYVSAETLTTNSGISNADIRFQNIGIFQAATVGVPTGSASIDLGELWVSYKVRLFKPTIYGALAAIQSSHYYTSAATGAPITTTPFGANVSSTIQPTAAPQNQLPLTFTTNTFSFPLAITQGIYMVNMVITSGTQVTLGVSAATVVNGSLLDNMGGDTEAGAWVPVNATVTQSASNIFFVNVNAPGSSLCTVTIHTTVIPTSNAVFDLFVTPWNVAMTL